MKIIMIIILLIVALCHAIFMIIMIKAKEIKPSKDDILEKERRKKINNTSIN